MTTATQNEFYNLTVWSMNGGPVPSEALRTLSEAVEAAIKDIETKSGVRLLYAVNTAREAE